MKENISLDRELLRTFIGNEPLGTTQMSESMLMASTNYMDPETDVQSDRLRIFEEFLAKSIEEQADTNSDIPTRAKSILEKFDEITEGFRDGISETMNKEIEKKLVTNLETVSSNDKNEAAYRVLAIDIINDFNIIFEADLRRKINDSILSSSLPGETEVYALRAKEQKVLLIRNLVRWALWVGSMYTSWLGISSALAWGVDHWTKEGYSSQEGVSLGIKTASVLLGVPAAIAASEVIRRVKVAIEFIGATKNLSFTDSCKELARTRKAYAILFCILLTLDVGTNIEGGYDYFLGGKDTVNQLDDVKVQYQAEIERIQGEIKKMDEQMKSQISKQALKALIDEANGTHSEMSGIGPRFYGIGAAYFGETPFNINLNGNLSECVIDKSKETETAGDWSIYNFGDSWCVEGSANNTKIEFGFGKLFAGQGNTADIFKNKRNQPDYRRANSVYEEFRKDNPESFVDAMTSRWNIYIKAVEESYTTQISSVNAITNAWAEDTNIMDAKEASNTKIYPALKKIETDANTLQGTLLADLTEISKTFVRFDANLIQALDKDGEPVNIQAPQLETVSFDIKAANFSEDLEARNAFQKSLKLIEKNYLNSIMVGFVCLLAGIFSYADMGFFTSVKKSFQSDLERVRLVNEEFIKYIHNILETLNTHLNRGPFRKFHTPDSLGEKDIPETFIRKKFEDSIVKKSESLAFEGVQKGVLSLIISRLKNYIFKKPSSENPQHSLHEELNALIRNFTGEDSPILNSFFRIRRSVMEFADEETSYSEEIMKLGNGDTNMNVAELIKEIYEKMPNPEKATGDDFANRFRRDLWGLITRKSVSDIEEKGTLYSRVDNGIQNLSQLEKSMDIHSEQWLLDLTELEEVIRGIMAEPTMLESDNVAKNKLHEAYKKVKSGANHALVNFEKECKKAWLELKQNVREQTEDQEYQAYEDAFNRINSKIESARHYIHETAHQSTFNTFGLLNTLNEKIKQIKETEAEIDDLSPDGQKSRKEKMRLRTERNIVEAELLSAKNSFNGSDKLTKKIYKNRAHHLLKVSIDLQNNSIPQTPAKAKEIVHNFLNMYAKFYRGHGDFVKIENSTDYEMIAKAYKHFADEMRNNEKTMGFDNRSVNYKYDPAWYIGTALQAAFIELNSNVNIEIPDRLIAKQMN